MEDVAFATARETAAAIRGGDLSAVEALEVFLDRVRRHNPSLNAVVTLDEEGAREKARQADDALGRGEEWGPLHGVPITLEDCHATAGIRSTWGGLPRLAEYVPEEDSMVPARLKAVGAIVFGKTHGPEVWPDSLFDNTNNPWNPERTSGGSSAGPGAALAAGLTTLDIGMDTLGSIQNPAHYCGVFGMRPTEHRVPLTGAFFVDPARKFRIMSTTGPMARSVDDLRLALRLIAGPDGLDTHVPPIPWHDVERVEVGNLRVAWSSGFPGSDTQDDIRAATENVARELAEQGAAVEESMPAVDLGRQCELAWELFGLLADTFSAEPSAFSETAGAPSEVEEYSSLEVYLMALDRRDEMMRAWEKFFSDRDVLILPAGTNTAERHGEEPEPSSPEDYPYGLSAVSGCPMIVVPAGVDRQGLPFGLQVIGRRWDDERLLAIAESLSEMTGGFRRPPGY